MNLEEKIIERLEIMIDIRLYSIIERKLESIMLPLFKEVDESTSNGREPGEDNRSLKKLRLHIAKGKFTDNVVKMCRKESEFWLGLQTGIKEYGIRKKTTGEKDE